MSHEHKVTVIVERVVLRSGLGLEQRAPLVTIDLVIKTFNFPHL